MIKYIGSKRALIPWIVGTVGRINDIAPVRSVTDLFTGTGRVAHALKDAGYYVSANDLLTYSYTLATALVAADARRYPSQLLRPLLDTLSTQEGHSDWFTQLYAHEARYFQPKNAARIEAVRERIDELARGDPVLRAVLLTSLMLAADKVDSTTGVQMAYLKGWAPRAYNDLCLECPPLLCGPGEATQEDACDAAGATEADAVYVDPPYNQHSYLGNYHVWETLVLWDRPLTYGVARKRIDCRARKSAFNSKTASGPALRRLFSVIRANHLIVSFNDEGFFTAREIADYLETDRYVVRLERPYKRYVGALIGIYNPSGEKVGRVSHTTNREYLFVATKSRKVFEGLTESDAAPADGPRS